MIGRLTQLQMLSLVDDAAIYQCCRLFAETEAIATTQQETAATIELIESNLQGLDPSDLLAVQREIAKLRRLTAFRYRTLTRQGRIALRQYLREFGLSRRRGLDCSPGVESRTAP